MKIYNTSQFEKLKINPINLNDFDNLNLNVDGFPIIKNIVKDIDGNFYDGIEINGKIWMASNLRTTKFNDGVKISRFNDSRNVKIAYYEYPNDPNISETLFKKYGLYYNFKAIETGKLAPKGWHVPTMNEFEDLFSYIASNDKFNLTPKVTDPFVAHIAKSMCSQEGWEIDTTYTNAVGNNVKLNNKTKFNLFPSGLWNYHLNNSSFIHRYTCLWSCTSTSIGNVWTICITNDDTYIKKGEANKYFGYSIRCVKD